MTRGVGDVGDRGMANLVGIVLLVGLTLVGAIAVVVVGTVALGSVSDQTQDDLAQDEMRELSARLSTVADSPIEDNTRFRMPGRVNVSSARITIAATNSSVDTIPTNPDDQATNPDTLSAGPTPLVTIVYDRSDGTQLAYQGGGVWSAGSGQTMIVSRPGLDYDGSTVDFLIVNVSRAETVTHDGEVVAHHAITSVTMRPP